MSNLYKTVRTSVDKCSSEERVEVNQRALIDKILARYASAGAVYRELLQNSNDAEANIAEVYFTTDDSNIVTQVLYRNNGMPFRNQDWARLKKIAEGNPDESKIGAFGVGAYTMFSICEEPIILSGNQALAFVWKGDALWTKTIDNQNSENKKWTSFVLPSRDPYPLPDMSEFGDFLCASLTFTRCLGEIRVFVNNKQRMTITKTLVQPPSVVQILKSSGWFKRDGAVIDSPNGLFSLKDENSLLESFYHVQVTLDGETAAVTARYLSATAKTSIPAAIEKRMERVTKKKPPSKVEVQIFLNGQQQIDEAVQSGRKSSKAHKIIQSFSPPFGGGRIFIGFRTSQTTGLAAHLSAPFVPTVEREAMDLQDQTLRLFNLELLEFSGILMRLALEHGMSVLGLEYEKGAVERAKLEEQLLLEEQKKQQTSTQTTQATLASRENVEQEDTTVGDTSTGSSSSVWGFAKFMAKGVKKKIVKVLNSVEEMVDDGGELIHPKDTRPLCSSEHQAIVLMQSFCPQQSTPDPLVGTALAQGFSRCLPDKVPPVLTRSGVVPGDQARLPYKGMESFCKEGVIRTIVYKNAEEYHNVIARCRTLNLDDLAVKLAGDVLEEAQLIRLLRWWVRFSRIHPNVTSFRGVDIKENIRFFLETNEDADVLPVYSLKDYLFYLDKDKIRSGNGNSTDDLPMPDAILPKAIQDKVSLRTITDTSLREWFSPLPIEIWIEYISHHRCMTSGQPEDEKLRLQVLSTLSQEYARRPMPEQSIFGSFCQSVLKERRCIPFDSDEPTTYCADCPSYLYLYSAELHAFDGVGNFHKASQSLQHSGISEDFLVALGVRKSVAIEFLFANLGTLRWSDDPKPLVEYLRSATLTNQDVKKLMSTQYLPAENDPSRMFAPSEIYLPDRELRVFPFLKLLQWPSDDEVTERTLNGKFLVKLGMKVVPPLLPLLKYISDEVKDDMIRIKCLEFVCKRLGSGGVYHTEYSRIGKSQKGTLKFLPCVVKSPIENAEEKGLYSVLHCCSEERCGVMGFPIIDPALDSHGVMFGSLFQCVPEPSPQALVQQLMILVNKAKTNLKSCNDVERVAASQRMIGVFALVFKYLSSRSSEINSSLMAPLKSESFIPCLVGKELEWHRPEEVFFKNHSENSDSLTESLFQVTDFSPFLSAAGVASSCSTQDIFRLMLESPQTVLSAVKSEANYRILLRRVAANPPFKRITPDIRNAPFLLAYTISQGEDSKEESNYQLAKAEDIYIIDNSFFGRMFPVLRAPHENDLEDFYSLIGSKFISKQVQKQFDVLGTAKKDTSLTLALGERILQRSPLLVSPSITSRPLVPGAAQVLDETKLIIQEAPDLKAVYSLGKSVRSQHTTCCSQQLQGKKNKNVMYVTKDFDWFDVGFAIGELILLRCQLEDAFFISSLLEAPLEQLRARGFPVDRIIKPEPIPEPVVRVTPPPSAVETPSKLAAAPTISAGNTAPTISAGNKGTLAEIPPKENKSDGGTVAEIPPKESKPNGGTVAEMPPKENKSYRGTAAEIPPKESEPYGGTVAETPSEDEESSKELPKSQVSASNNESNTDPPMSQEGYVAIMKQMYPDADEEFIRNRLGENPTLDDVRSLAEEMSAGSYPKKSDGHGKVKGKGAAFDAPVKNKILGSKKLGQAFNGLRGSSFGGASAPKRGVKSEQPTFGAHTESSMMGPPQLHGNDVVVPPEADANSHANMEKMLEQTVGQSSRVDANGVSSAEHTEMSIPEGLDRGKSCEVVPGQDLKPFAGPNQNTQAHNGIRVFSARKAPSSEEFLRAHFDAVESFAVVLERLCGVYGLQLSSVCIFHDPAGGTIAFNSNKSLHFNVRFFFALHYGQNKQRDCYSYWFVTTAHELAHHMASGHNKEHGFYTESYVSLYLPKLVSLFATLDPTG
jgi:hypothetical protein